MAGPELVFGPWLLDAVAWAGCGRSVSRTHGSGADLVYTGERTHFQETIKYPDGKERDVDITYVPDISENGKVRGCFALVIDITERKQAEDELRQNRDQLRLITDNLPVLINYWDSE